MLSNVSYVRFISGVVIDQKKTCSFPLKDTSQVQ